MFPRRWEELSSADLQHAPGALGLVPVGGIEPHGAGLPMGTDSIVARALCAAASERCGALVLPAIETGCGPDDDLDLPGALSLGAAQLVALAVRWSERAARSGLRRLVFVDAGAGNAHALAEAVRLLGELRPGLDVSATAWWALDGAVEAACGVEPLHGGRAESSVVLAVAPELVRVGRHATPEPPSLDLGVELLERAADALAERIETPAGLTAAPAPALA